MTSIEWALHYFKNVIYNHLVYLMLMDKEIEIAGNKTNSI